MRNAGVEGSILTIRVKVLGESCRERMKYFKEMVNIFGVRCQGIGQRFEVEVSEYWIMLTFT